MADIRVQRSGFQKADDGGQISDDRGHRRRLTAKAEVNLVVKWFP